MTLTDEQRAELEAAHDAADRREEWRECVDVCRCGHGEDWHGGDGCEARGCPCAAVPR